MGKESGTQFLKALKDAIGESAIDGEARHAVEKETEARIKADNELTEAIDAEKEARIAAQAEMPNYTKEWEVSGVPDGMTVEYCHGIGDEFISGIVCKLNINTGGQFGTYDMTFTPPSNDTKAYLTANVVRIVGEAFGSAYNDVTYLSNLDCDYDTGACTGELPLDSTIDSGTIYISLLCSAVGPYSVDESTILNNSISTDKIKGKAVTASKIADGAITTAKLAANAVTSDTIKDYAVGESKLNAASVSERTIINGVVTTAKLTDKAVTQAKIADNAVGTNQLGYGVVTKAKMAESSVGTEELVDGSVTKAKLTDAFGMAMGSASVTAAANTYTNFTITPNATIGILDNWVWFFLIDPTGYTANEVTKLNASCIGKNTDGSLNCWIYNSSSNKLTCDVTICMMKRAAFTS